MNILLWPAHYLPQIGGLEVLSHHLALELKKNGHSLLVLANHFHKETKRHYSIDGIDVVTFPFLNTLAYYDLRSIKEILSSIGHLIHSFHPDIIHIHGWLETFCFYQSRTLNKIRTPVCLTIHGLLEQSHYETENCMKVWKRANCITAVSDAMIESLRQYQFQHLCIERIYNGLPKPTKPHQPLLTQHKLVMIGRLAEEKYFHIAFHALKKLAKTFPNLQLTLVGDGVEMQKLCRLRMDLGLEKQIHMTGFVHPSEIDRFIDEASIVLIPSSYESFSLVALQAAFRKRPVIASNVYGLNEVVEDQKTGFLVPPKDPTALADKIEYLLKRPDVMKSMGENGYQRALTLFTIEQATNSYLKTYEHAIQHANTSCQHNHCGL